MRILFVLTATVAAALSMPAHAQTVKAKGAALAGVCAGSLEWTAGYSATSKNPNPQVIQNMQRARDYYAEYPKFDQTEIKANAENFIRQMSGRLSNAQDADQAKRVHTEVFAIAQNCFITAQKNGAPVTSAPAAVQPQPGTVQPSQPLPTQPLTTQPLATQPLTLQPAQPQPGTITVQ